MKELIEERLKQLRPMKDDVMESYLNAKSPTELEVCANANMLLGMEIQFLEKLLAL